MAVQLVVGVPKQFTASPRDAAGTVLTGRQVLWESLDSSKYTVSTDGLVTPLSTTGSVFLRATVDGIVGTVELQIIAMGTLALLENGFTKVPVGAVVDFFAKVADLSTAPLAGKTVTATVNNGNATVSYPDGQLTGADGTVRVRVTGAVTGAVTLTASSPGVPSATVALTVVAALTTQTLAWEPGLNPAQIDRPRKAATLGAVPYCNGWIQARRIVAAKVGKWGYKIGDRRNILSVNPGTDFNVQNLTWAYDNDLPVPVAGVPGAQSVLYTAPAYVPGDASTYCRTEAFNQSQADQSLDKGPYPRFKSIVIWLKAGDATAVGKRIFFRETRDGNVVGSMGRSDFAPIILTADWVSYRFVLVIKDPAAYDEQGGSSYQGLFWPKDATRALKVKVMGGIATNDEGNVYPPENIFQPASYDPKYGIMASSIGENCWRNCDHPREYTGGVSIAGSSRPAPDADQYPDGWVGGYFTEVTMPPGSEISAPYPGAPHIIRGDGNEEFGFYNQKPEYIHGGAYIAAAPGHALPAPGSLGFRLRYNGGDDPAAVNGVMVRDDLHMCEPDGTGFWSARNPVVAANIPASKIMLPSIVNLSGSTMTFLIYRCFSSPEGMSDQRNSGTFRRWWVPMKTFNANEIHDQHLCESTVVADVFRTLEGYYCTRRVFPFDLFSLKAMGMNKCDIWQHGPEGSADYNFAGVIYPQLNVGEAWVTMEFNYSTSGGTGGDTIRIPVYAGDFPAWVDTDIGIWWAGGRFRGLYIGIGAAPGRWYHPGDLFGNGQAFVGGWAGGAAVAVDWEFTGRAAWQADRDRTGQWGAFHKTHLAGKIVPSGLTSGPTLEPILEGEMAAYWGARKAY